MAADSSGESLPLSRPPALPPVGRLLGVDWGAKRIGLAVSDPAQTVATPLDTLSRRTGRRFPMQRLKSHLDALQPVGIVVGLPLTEDGREDVQSAAARETGTLIAAKSGLPVAYQDERMTTARALGAVRDLGGTTRGRERDVDRLAATVLLQAFLDGRRAG